MTSTTDVVTMTKAELTKWLDGDDIAVLDDFEELDYEQAMKILTAPDQAAVLKPDDVREAKSMSGETFTVLSISWRKSTKREDGKGRYALMQCVDKNGEPFIMSCGATKVVLQLRRAEIEGWFPWTIGLESTLTNNNRTVYELAPPASDF